MTLKHLAFAVATIGIAGSALAQTAIPPLVLFEGAIGVDPFTGVNGVDVLNTVRGVSPGGRAWVIRKFKARIGIDGSISARGAGLLFASGDVIGTRGPVAAVAATLVCGPADATAAKFTSPPAPLDTAGDFQIKGTLTDANGGMVPATCDNPVLLIRAANAATGVAGAWFAAGIVSSGDDD